MHGVTLDGAGSNAHDAGMAVGQAIRAARARAALTQEQLAARLEDVRQADISYWERGARPIELQAIPKIEAALGLRRGELLLAAGLVEPEGVERAILADPGLDPLRKSLLVETYRGFLRTTKELGKKLGTVN